MVKSARLPALVVALMLALAPAVTLVSVSPAQAQTTPAPDAPAAAPPAAPDAGGMTAATEKKVDNPYGIEALWTGGDLVSHTVLVILAIMSIGTWYILVTKAWEQSSLFRAGKLANRDFWTGNSVEQSITRLRDTSPFRYIAETGVQATHHHEGTMVEQIDQYSWVSMSVQRAVDAIGSRLRGGLAFLATVGSTAPFVGLFGTVWGIMHALTAIGIAGQASIDKVAGPVGEALIMTAFGLAVAVPAVLAYNWLVGRNKSAMEIVKNFAADLHNVLLSGSRIGETSRGKAA
jgi:biopolymer transport protein ExbB